MLRIKTFFWWLPQLFSWTQFCQCVQKNWCIDLTSKNIWKKMKLFLRCNMALYLGFPQYGFLCISGIWKTTSLSQSVSSHKVFYTISLKKFDLNINCTWKERAILSWSQFQVYVGHICVKPHHILEYIFS